MTKGNVSDGVVFHAGFPNAAEDRAGQGLSLDELVFRHRASTYLWRLDAAIVELGWLAGSIVVVDRALDPHQNDLVIATSEEGFVVRKLHQAKLYDPAGKLEQAEDIAIWGVVTHVLQGYRG